MKKNIRKKILTFLIIISSFLISVNVKAECYRTLTGNSYIVNYSDDNTKITSVTINFSYVDSADLFGLDNSNRRYNLIFTKDSTKKDEATTAFQNGIMISELASNLEINDAIYSDDAMVGQESVTYVRKTVSECSALTGATVISEEYCTLITGTYTTSDRSVLGRFEPNTMYYGLLASGFSGGGAWYTNVPIEVQVENNRSFIKLDDDINLVVTVTNNHNPAQKGDVLTAHSDADEVTYNWYYDDDLDGIPDEGTFLGSGDTYDISFPDDMGHNIICVAVQNKDENGNDLSESSKPRKVSEPIPVLPIEKGKINVVEPETPNANDAKIIDSSEDIEAKIDLTTEEQEAINLGKNISIYLEVKDISDSISSNDKESFENSFGESNELGMYLDVSLYKKVDDENPVKITEVNSPITVTFELPEELLNKDSKVDRTYTIYVLKDGEVTSIDTKVEGNILTFETDSFSTYALTYIDTKITNNPNTVDIVIAYITLFVVSIGGIAGSMLHLKRRRFD